MKVGVIVSGIRPESKLWRKRGPRWPYPASEGRVCRRSPSAEARPASRLGVSSRDGRLADKAGGFIDGETRGLDVS